ncbi:transposase [Candidatus Competibacter phosphatis]|uniref:transposase n=1 Tax=Candidatus Competibacter phosphatis TaxID=221280 RepID=UPI0030B94730
MGWRKLHLDVDAENHEAIAVDLKAAFVGDAEVLPALLESLPADGPVTAVAADGAYDTRTGHAALLNRQAAALIPPRADAVAWSPLADGRTHPRTAMVEHLRQQGSKSWKIESGYHRRSLAETAMFRLKTRFDDPLRNRRFDTQTTSA